jgi:hypothetical protein
MLQIRRVNFFKLRYASPTAAAPSAFAEVFSITADSQPKR